MLWIERFDSFEELRAAVRRFAAPTTTSGCSSATATAPRSKHEHTSPHRSGSRGMIVLFTQVSGELGPGHGAGSSRTGARGCADRTADRGSRGDGRDRALHGRRSANFEDLLSEARAATSRHPRAPSGDDGNSDGAIAASRATAQTMSLPEQRYLIRRAANLNLQR